jgi:hypothetical protein
METVALHHSTLVSYSSSDALNPSDKYENGEFDCVINNANKVTRAIKCLPYKVLVPNVFPNVPATQLKLLTPSVTLTEDTRLVVRNYWTNASPRTYIDYRVRVYPFVILAGTYTLPQLSAEVNARFKAVYNAAAHFDAEWMGDLDNAFTFNANANGEIQVTISDTYEPEAFGAYQIELYGSTRLDFDVSLLLSSGTGNNFAPVDHTFLTGDSVQYDNGGNDNLPGLVNGQTYYVRAENGASTSFNAGMAFAVFQTQAEALDATNHPVGINFQLGMTGTSGIHSFIPVIGTVPIHDWREDMLFTNLQTPKKIIFVGGTVTGTTYNYPGDILTVQGDELNNTGPNNATVIATLNLEEGFYSVDEFIVELNTLLNTQYITASTTQRNHIKLVSADVSNQYLYLNSPLLIENMGWEGQVVEGGYTKLTEIFQGTGAFVGHSMINFGGEKLVHVSIKEVAAGNMVCSDGTERNVVCSIPLHDVEYGQYACLAANDVYVEDVDYRSHTDLSKVRVQILDKNFNTLKIQKSYPVIVIMKIYHRDTINY